MNLYLSQLTLNLRNHNVQTDLRNCHAMHKRIMSVFSDLKTDTPRKELGILYQINNVKNTLITLLIQSNQSPDWSKLPQNYILSPENIKTREITPILGHLKEEQFYRFQLTATPCKKVSKELDEGIKDKGRRIPLRTIDEKIEWLNRKGEQHGFALKNLTDILPLSPTYGRKQDTGTITHYGVKYTGILQITNPEQFKSTLQSGIGPAKSYGFGMLTLSK